MRKRVLARSWVQVGALCAAILLLPTAVVAAVGSFTSDTATPAASAVNSAAVSGAAGVLGRATGTSGQTAGVKGISASTSGIGTHGVATAATGATTGVSGTSGSTSGRGVRGAATATSGATIGVLGSASASPSGTGVRGVGGTSGFGVFSQGHLGVSAGKQLQCTGCIAPATLNFDPATQAEVDALSAAGTINDAANPVDWTRLKNVPGPIADGADDVDGGTAANLACTGCVGAGEIAADAVGAGQIATGAVGPLEIADSAVGASEIVSDAVGQTEIATNAVTTDEIALNTIQTEDIDTFAVGTNQIANAAVNSLKIAPDAVQAAAIAQNAVGAGHIQLNAVGQDQIALDGVGSSEIAAGAVGTSEVALNSIAADDIATNAVGSDEIASGAVGSDEIALNSIAADDIATNAVGSDEIATNAVGSDEIATNAVTADEILNGTVAVADLSFDPAEQGELDALKIAGTINNTSNPVDWTKLKNVPDTIADGADAIDGGNAANVTCTGCIDSTEILDGTITTGDLAFAPILSNTSTTPQPAGIFVDGRIRTNGMLRLGSETGAAAPPPGFEDILVRGMRSSDPSAGSVIARTSNVTLERDGTNGGIQVRSLSPVELRCDGIDGSRNHVAQLLSSNTIFIEPQPVFTDAQSVFHATCTFDDASLSGDVTTVTFMRVGGVLTGHIVSNVNQ